MTQANGSAHCLKKGYGEVMARRTDRTLNGKRQKQEIDEHSENVLVLASKTSNLDRFHPSSSR